MTTKSYRTSIIKLGLPILVGQLGMIVVGFADNIMVGRYSTEALASASFVNNLFNITMFCCIGFAYGLTPIIGSLFTRERHEDIGATMRAGLWLNIAFNLLVMAVMATIYFNLHRMGQPAELLPLIRPYFLIYLCGMLPVTVFNVFAQWSYGIKNTSLPMWIILVTNVVNIIGNYVLIYGNFGAPELGLVGAGLSTLLARIIAPVAIMTVFFCFRRNALYRKGYCAARINRASLWRIWKMSIPVSMQMTFESGSFTVAAVMSGWLGTVALAAFQIVVITGTLGFCIYYSIGSAVAILVANEAGRADNAAMRRVAWAGYQILLCLMVLSSLIFIFFGRSIMHAFTDDSIVLALAYTLIFPLVLYQVADATQINFANALRGTSRVMPMLWIAFVSYVIIGVPSTYLLGFTFGLGVYGIILSFSCSLLVAALLFLCFFLKATPVRNFKERALR